MLYYTIILLVSIGLSVIYFSNRFANENRTVFFIYILAPFSILGYYWMGNATNLQEALLANMVNYTGSAFLTYLTLLTIVYFCKIKLPPIWILLGFLVSLFEYISLLTNDAHHLFYKEVDFVRTQSGGHLLKTYGPLHTLFYITFIMHFVLGVFTVVYGIKKKKDASMKDMLLLLCMEGMGIFAFFAGRMISSFVEAAPVAYVSFQLVLLIIQFRGRLYDYSFLMSKVLADRKELGYVSFDNNMNYLGADDTMRDWFPGLNDLRIDRRYVPGMAYYREISTAIQRIDDNNGSYELVIPHAGRFYKLKGSYLIAGKKKRGYSLFFEDDTRAQKEHQRTVFEKEHDAMTGLYNRGKYMELTAEYYRGLDSIAILNMDLNDLKKTNDTHGHEAGDRLIDKAAQSVKALLKENVKGFRLGGDEFVVIAENVTRAEAEALLKQWKETVEKLNREPDGIHLVIACGFVYSDKNYRLESLFREADSKMYSNKKRLKQKAMKEKNSENKEQ